MTELLPCPFCGSAAKLLVHDAGACVSCTGDYCEIAIADVTERGAVKAWNTRANPNKHSSLLAVDLDSGIAVTESGIYQPTQNTEMKAQKAWNETMSCPEPDCRHAFGMRCRNEIHTKTSEENNV